MGDALLDVARHFFFLVAHFLCCAIYYYTLLFKYELLRPSHPYPIYSTSLGSCHHADALTLLRSFPDASVNLVLTSPPYALRRKKAYGNVSARAYLDWFLPFTEEINRALS